MATRTQEAVTSLGGIYDILSNDAFAERMNGHMNRYFPIEWADEQVDRLISAGGDILRRSAELKKFIARNQN